MQSVSTGHDTLFDAEQWVYEQWYGASRSMWRFFYLHRCVGYKLYIWWCRTCLDLSNINRTCGLIVAKQASCLEMRCISCYRSSFLPRYLNHLYGSCCIFSATCFHISEARSVLHCWNITFQDIRNRKWCLLPFFGNNDIWSYNRQRDRLIEHHWHPLAYWYCNILQPSWTMSISLIRKICQQNPAMCVSFWVREVRVIGTGMASALPAVETTASWLPNHGISSNQVREGDSVAGTG